VASEEVIAAENEERTMVLSCQVIVANPRFDAFMALVIICNCFALAADTYDASEDWKWYAYYQHVTCCCVFILESMVRFVASGSAGVFFSSNFHKFESLLISLTVAGLAVEYKPLYLLPALRMYRLMMYLPTLYHLLESALSSFNAIINLMLFIFMISICFCSTGR
jgi:hypothetical protein